MNLGDLGFLMLIPLIIGGIIGFLAGYIMGRIDSGAWL